MAPVLLFLATQVALALNSNRYNVTENIKHVDYFPNETLQAVIPTFSNKGTMNRARNESTPRWRTSADGYNKVLTRSSTTSKSNDRVNFEVTQSRNLNVSNSPRVGSNAFILSINDSNSTEAPVRAQISKVVLQNENFQTGPVLSRNPRRFQDVSVELTRLNGTARTKSETSGDISITSGQRNTYQTSRIRKALVSDLLVTPSILKREGFSTLLNSGSFSSNDKVTPAPESFRFQRSTATDLTKANNNLNGFEVPTTSYFNVFNATKNESDVQASREFTTQFSQSSEGTVSKTTLKPDAANRSDTSKPRKFVNDLRSSNKTLVSRGFEVTTTPTSIYRLDVSGKSTTLDFINRRGEWTTNGIQDLLHKTTLSPKTVTKDVLETYNDSLMTASTTDITEVYEVTELVIGDAFVDSPSNVSVKVTSEFPWPVKKEAVVEGDLVLGGLMMVHEREDTITCGPIMPQGGIQALEAMLYTLDHLNEASPSLLPNITLGAHILDDCDKDTYGLEMAVDFIKGKIFIV